MKAVFVEGPFDIKIVDIPKPLITKPTDVLIRVLSGGLCGSDIGIYNGSNSLVTYPRIIGHEYGGVVVEIGSGVTRVKIGDYVAVDPVRTCGSCYACTHDRHNVCAELKVTGVHCDGGFSEYVLSPEEAVYPVDNSILPPELLCMVEPYSIGIEVCRRAKVTAGDKMLIMGCGPIGACILQIAKTRGVAVMMMDIVEERLQKMLDLGADRIVHTQKEDIAAAVKAFTGGEGMPVIADTICQPWSMELAVSLTCPAARIVCLSTNNKTASIPLAEITKKELDIVGSRLSNYGFPEVIALMAEGKLSPEKLRTSMYQFTDVEAAIRQVMEHPETECKVTLCFG